MIIRHLNWLDWLCKRLSYDALQDLGMVLGRSGSQELD